MKRKPMNRFKAARSFNRNSGRTKAINVRPIASRGGYRL